MITIARPVDDLEDWTRGVDRLLSSIFLNENRPVPTTWRPPTDVYEVADQVVIKVEIAGMNAGDFELSFSNHILRIQGTRSDRERKLSYHCLEIPYGDFLSEVYLPGQYDQEHIEAHYDNGFLTITLPKLEIVPHTIEVHTDQ